MTAKIMIVTLLYLLLTAVHPLHAAVMLDGTLGRSGAVKGPYYAITSDLGRQAGANLFHSFSTFNLVKGDVATFSGPAGIANIISRVTGGSASSIDGMLKSTISAASIYFLNPAGVIFGPDASLDISGSFHVSTADYLKLGTDGRFDVAAPASSVLTTSPPSAFGFASTKPAGIWVTGSTLSVPASATLSLVGGDIAVGSGETDSSYFSGLLKAPGGGRLNVASVASPGEVVFDSAGISMKNFAVLGNIAVTDASGISVSDQGAGSLFIRGGNLVVSDNSYIAANTSGTVNGGTIDIRLSGNLDISNYAGIKSIGASSGGGRKTSIEAQNLNLFEGGFIATSTFGSGNGGDLAITLRDTFSISGSISDPGKIESNSQGSGNAGKISISAPHISIANGGEITGYSRAAGRGAFVALQGDTLQCTNGGLIDVSGFGAGRGAELSLNFRDSIIFSGKGQYSSGLYATTDAGGSAANIMITTPNLKVTDKAVIRGNMTATATSSSRGADISLNVCKLEVTGVSTIDVNNYGSGVAGNLAITATDSVLLSGKSAGAYSGLYSQNYGDGTAGAISISSPALQLTDGGRITSITRGAGQGGNISFDTGSLGISGTGSRVTTTTYSGGRSGGISIKASDTVSISDGGIVFSMAESGSTGDAGGITVDAGKLNISGSSTYISSSTYSDGRSGNISIKASDGINLTGGGSVGCIAGEGSKGDAGMIAVDTGKLVISGSNSVISSSTLSYGKSGSVSIKASDTISISDGGGVACEARPGSKGNAGNVTLDTARLFISGSKTGISSTTGSDGNGGNVSIKASDTVSITDGATVFCQAQKPDSKGNAGNIMVDTAKLILAGSTSTRNTGINSSTFSSGNGGSVSIRASDSVRISGGAGVVCTSEAGSRGDAGVISVDTGKLTISGGDSRLSSSTFSFGNGGSLSIRASDSVTISDGGAVYSQAEQKSNGNAGNILLDTGVLDISGSKSGVTSSTYSSGRGGNIIFKASDSVTVADGGAVISIAGEGSTGDAGTVMVDTGKLVISGGSAGKAGIFASTTFGNGGNVSIKAFDTVTISDGGAIGCGTEEGSAGRAGEISISVKNNLSLKYGLISTASASGGGGSIFIAPQLLHLKNSSITTSVRGGSGNGGNIDLTARQFVLDNSRVVAQADAGNGGNININSDVYIQSITGSLISASSNLGLQGTVLLSSPVIDVNAALVEMPSTLRDMASLSPRRCIASGDVASSFVVYACGLSARQPDAAIIGK